MTERAFRPGAQPADHFQRDLNPNPVAGQNHGAPPPAGGPTPAGPRHPERSGRTAYDLKQVHRRLHDFADSDLKQIRIVPEGSRLEQGATYVDLSEAEPREFETTGEMVAGPKHWYVAKRDVDYQLWNLLIGVRNHERLGTADDS